MSDWVSKNIYNDTKHRAESLWQLSFLLKLKQELSYRKQIARKLCKQYVEGIYSINPVTLKSVAWGSFKVTENCAVR